MRDFVFLIKIIKDYVPFCCFMKALKTLVTNYKNHSHLGKQKTKISKRKNRRPGVLHHAGRGGAGGRGGAPCSCLRVLGPHTLGDPQVAVDERPYSVNMQSFLCT